MSAALLALLLWVVPGSRAQLAGNVSEEAAPALTVRRCSGSRCHPEELSVTLDAQYRWVHDADGYDNCFDAGKWDEDLCETGVDCAKNCAIDGVDKKGYPGTYGVAATPDGIKLSFAVKGEYGTNYGSRVYVLDGEDTYKMFKLKNREFSFDVDISKLPCGLNGAVYFVAMDSKGDSGKGQNEAGAKYGLGYCDAQCPRGQKFVEGVANVEGWDASTGLGNVGACCAEVDLFEANTNSSAMTVHPCASEEPSTCEEDECDKKTICDKDGCQYNPYHMGNPWFYGPGEAFLIDTTKKFTVVTQFITEDGTDDGDLTEMRRFYIQDGLTWALPNVHGAEKKREHVSGNSLSDEYCSTKNGDELFGAGGEQPPEPSNGDESLGERRLGDRLLEQPAVPSNGYMKKVGEALDRGMALILSVWDDQATNMAWLDSSSESSESPVWEGPCFEDSADIRDSAPHSSVTFANIAYGELFSTCPSCKDAEIPTHKSLKSKTTTSTTATTATTTTTTAPTTTSTTTAPSTTPPAMNFGLVAMGALGGAVAGLVATAAYLKSRDRLAGFSSAAEPGSPVRPTE